MAIPHGKLAGLPHPLRMRWGSRTHGVDFASINRKPTQLFFALVAPENSAGIHLKALARISRLFRNADFREAILQAPDAAGIYTLISEEDARAWNVVIRPVHDRFVEDIVFPALAARGGRCGGRHAAVYQEVGRRTSTLSGLLDRVLDRHAREAASSGWSTTTGWELIHLLLFAGVGAAARWMAHYAREHAGLRRQRRHCPAHGADAPGPELPPRRPAPAAERYRESWLGNVNQDRA